MKRFEWDESLALGITLLDAQHKEWIERLNQLSAALESNQEVEHISNTLRFMAGYAEFHFAQEEKLMAEHHYPGLERQQREHKKFRDALTGLMVLQIGQPDALRKISDSVNNFQIAWLTNHIKTADREFSEFLDENVSGDVPESV